MITWVLTVGEPVWLFSGFMPGPLFAIHLPKTWLDRYFAFNRIRGVKNTRNFQRMPKSCFVLTVIINQFLCNKKHVQLYRNVWEMAQCISKLSFLHLSNPLSMKHGAVKRTTVYLSSIFKLVSSVRSSNSHPDLLVIHHPTTFSDHTGPQHWTFTFWATIAI